MRPEQSVKKRKKSKKASIKEVPITVRKIAKAKNTKNVKVGEKSTFLSVQPYLNKMVFRNFAKGWTGCKIWDYTYYFNDDTIVYYIFRNEDISEMLHLYPKAYDLILSYGRNIFKKMKSSILAWKKYKKKEVNDTISAQYVAIILRKCFKNIFNVDEIEKVVNILIRWLKKKEPVTKQVLSAINFNSLVLEYDESFTKELHLFFTDSGYQHTIMKHFTIFYFQLLWDTLRIFCEFKVEEGYIAFNWFRTKLQIIDNIISTDPYHDTRHSNTVSQQGPIPNIQPTTSPSTKKTSSTKEKRFIYHWNRPRETIWLRAQRDNHEQVVEDVFGSVQLPMSCSQRLKENMIVILEKVSSFIKSGALKHHADDCFLLDTHKKFKLSVERFLSNIMEIVTNDGTITYWNSGMKTIVSDMFFESKKCLSENYFIEQCLNSFDTRFLNKCSRFFQLNDDESLKYLLTKILKFIIKMAADALVIVLTFKTKMIGSGSYEGELDQSQIWHASEPEDTPPQDVPCFEKEMKTIEADGKIDEKWKAVARNVLRWNQQLREEYANVMTQLREINR